MNENDKVPINPDDIHLLIHALVDGELDAATAIDVERRISAEPALAVEHARVVALSAAVSHLPRPEVSDAFLARIGAIGGNEAAIMPGPAASRLAGRFSSFDWRAMAASIVVTAVLASSGTWWATSSAPPDFADAVADAHRRGLLSASPVDVASSDRHTVKPWLDGRIGLSPPAVDLVSQGYKLLGGRVEVVDGTPVPALIYQHREHLITLVAAPLKAGRGTTQAVEDLSAGGFVVVHWSDDTFSYWAISDTERSALDEFAQRFRQATAKD